MKVGMSKDLLNGRKRLLWADSMKGWLMVLVILGHSFQNILEGGCFNNHIWNLIYSFHMPAFMAISGWFSYRDNRQQNGDYLGVFKRRFSQLLKPYLIWSLFQWLLYYRTVDKLFLIIYKPDAYFWFLWVLFWINLLFICCQWISDLLKIDELFTIAFASICLIIIMVFVELRAFGFQFIAYYFIFYSLGYCFHRFPKFVIKNHYTLASIAIVWFILAWFWNMHELPSWMPSISGIPNGVLQYLYRGLTASIAIILLFSIAPFISNEKFILDYWIREIGAISLGIYVIHLLLMGYITNGLSRLLPTCPQMTLICITFIITTFLSIIIAKRLRKHEWSNRHLLGKI